MKNEKKTSTSLKLKLYYAFFLLLALGFIYFLYPKQGSFKYEFQKGKPWGHETLISPFDYPIYKEKEQVQAEKDSLLLNFIPYFKMDPAVEEQQLTLLNRNLREVFFKYKNFQDTVKRDETIEKLESLYRRYYQDGILKNSVSSYGELEGKEFLNIIQNNRSKRVAVEDILSLKTAYLNLNDTLNQLMQSDTLLIGILKLFDANTYLAENLSYDVRINEDRKEELMSSVSTTRGVVQAGVRIISQGDVVNDDNFLLIESLRRAYERKRSYGGWLSGFVIGQMILVVVLLTVMVFYLQHFNKMLFWKKRNFSMIITTLVATFLLARLVHENEALSMYLIPVCILPIIIRTFIGARMAIFIHLITMFLIAFMVPNPFEFIFIQTVAGVFIVISLSKLHRRGHIVIAALLLIAVYSVMYFGFSLIKEGDLQSIDWREFRWFGLNGLLMLIAYPLIYVIERIFGFVSDVTLMELSDTNHPLLRELAEIAPGTFQHSMQIANMAEAIILRIGGNPMLVRAGALYHDVGKIKSSEYFIENQNETKNPHDELNHLESVQKIVSHVFDGVKLARKHNIPESIIDFIKMHHGKSVVKYFYLKYKEQHPNEEIDETQFMYPGPNPVTKETAVVMLADSVEAAARSLKEKNEKTLKELIDNIVDAKVRNHELDNAPITFRDVQDIKFVFLEKLKNIYHLRIEYPKENK